MIPKSVLFQTDLSVQVASNRVSSFSVFKIAYVFRWLFHLQRQLFVHETSKFTHEEILMSSFVLKMELYLNIVNSITQYY